MRTPSRTLARELIGHAAIGAGIGGAVALLLLFHAPDFYRTTLDGAVPEVTALVVGVALALLFAVDAGISGFVFMLFDDEL